MTVAVVLFDLGGVLIELAPGLPGIPPARGDATEQAELWDRWLHDPGVAAFESGAVDATTFAADLVQRWDLPLTPAEYLGQFTAWPVRLAPGARDLVRSVRPSVRTGCLSNSNPVHWPRKRDEMGIGQLVDEHFLSFQLGQVKPDPAIFETVIGLLAVDSDDVLFCDDNPTNVAAARTVGMRAELTRGIPQLRQALEGAGVVDPG